ncbi:MAG: TIGR00730 family Rossman fold protein [Burkholderiaceae bacterium]
MDDPSLNALRDAIMRSPAYRLAESDPDFLAGEALRSQRLQLEYLKPDMIMREHRIRSTVVVFGSARIVAPENAQAYYDTVSARRDALKADHEANPTADTHTALLDAERHLLQARRALHYSRYYHEARQFSQLVSCQFQHERQRDYVVITGGGPGIMMAANHGAHDVGCQSIGLNITLPHEQAPNPYMTPALAFRFHYFALRKMHFMLRAKALVAFPGGYGTLDELMEALTLVQTGKMDRIPIMLFGREYWERVIDFQFLVDEGMIDAADKNLITYVENAQEAVNVLKSHYGEDFHNGREI